MLHADFTLAHQVTLNGLALAECAIILARIFPTHPLSSTILAALAPSEPQHSLRITPAFLLGSALTIAGASFRIWAFRTLGALFTGEVSLRRDHALVTRGPYVLVRHPSYTGFAGVVVGSTLALLVSEGSYAAQAPRWVRAAAWAFAGWRMVTALVVLPRRIVREDEMLRGEFGEEWDAWARKTPYRVFPYVW